MKSVLVFGCGAYYKKKAESFNKRYNVIAYLDNHAKVCQGGYEATPVYQPKDIFSLPNVPIFIMTSICNAMDIYSQLTKIGVPKDRIFFGANELPALNMVEEMLRQTNGQIVASANKMAIKIKGDLFAFSNENEYKEAIRHLRELANPLAYNMIHMPIQQAGKDFGGEFGTPVDRYYIEKFLANHQQFITGDVLEIAEDTYTYRFGHDIKHSYKLHINGDDGCIKGNLETGEGIKENSIDCFICTQTLQMMYDIHSAIRNIHRMLRPGGIALITAHGISQIAMHSYTHWGEYWRFTKKSMQLLMEEAFLQENITIHNYGNIKTALCFLYGLCVEDLNTDDFAENDEMFQLILGAVVKKQ